MRDVDDGATVSRMRIGVDETRVEDLLSKRSDQLVCGLTEEKAFSTLSVSGVKVPPGHFDSRLSDSGLVF